MSWDVSLHTHKAACEHCGRGEESDIIYDVNYTSNMYPMLKRAGFDWDEINGKSALIAGGRLNWLILQLENDRAGYEALNPSNGWGNYSSFVEWLRGIATACKDNSYAIFRISR